MTAPLRAETIRVINLTDSRWKFTPESQTIPVPYVLAHSGKVGEGENNGWHLPSHNATGWSYQWLSVERLANPSWWMIGPFPYGDHEGYNAIFPPEKEMNLNERYRGEGGAPIDWKYLTSPTYWVNLRELLKIPRPANSVAYAFSYVYSPVDRQGQIRVAFADSIKLWWNGELKLAVHRHPKWMLLRDPWAESVPVTIKRGWNRVLLKVTRSENRPISFLFRIADSEGHTIKDLVYTRAAEGIPTAQAVEGE